MNRFITRQSFVVAVVLFSAATTFAQDWVQPERSKANIAALARVQYKHYTFKAAGDIEMPYGLYVPTSYDKARPSPLVIALHGSGGDVKYMMEYNNLVELAERFGYIVATPMGYNERGWYGSRGPGNDFSPDKNNPGPKNLGDLSERDVMNVLEIVRRDLNIDARRIYLIGQSMGGGGVYWLAAKHPGLWRALAVMAPGVAPKGEKAYISPDILKKFPRVPILVIQGDADTAVDVADTRAWVAEMKRLGMPHEYLEIAGGTHASAGRLNIAKVFEFLSRH